MPQSNQYQHHASLTIRNIIYWSEFLDALRWVKGAHKKWKLFIQNNVEKIRKLTNVNMWRYCPGNLNPADLPSRGTTAADFYNLYSEWYNGPTFNSKDTGSSITLTQKTNRKKLCIMQQNFKWYILKSMEYIFV